MRSITLGLLTGLLFISSVASAAGVKTLSRYSEGSTEDGKDYQVFSVTCLDRTLVPITHWVADRQWCLGELAKESCVPRKMKAAVKACKVR